MSEGKDPAIKLFGKIIQCQWPPPYEDRFGASGSEPSAASVDDLDSEHNCSSDQNRNRSDDKSASPELADSKQDTVSSHTVISERKEASSSAITDNPNEETSSLLPSSKKEDQSETSTSQEKTPVLKKPDKIIPCPRCNSMDTKFCYFNNYNVNQPRHFCKNCQRYWTAGGTMRNVPVGAGRRRNKSSSVPINQQQQQHNRHFLIHDAFQTGSVVNGLVHQPTTLRAANGAILAFGSDFPLCESMASALNLGENSSLLNCMPNGVFRNDQPHQGGGYQLLSSGGPTNGSGDQSSGSCGSASIPSERVGNENEPAMKKNQQGVPVPPQPLHQQAPFFQETPWSSYYPWNPSTQWSSSTRGPLMHSGGIPMSFYTTTPPYWGFGMPGGSWNVSWASQASDQSSTSCTSPNSPLGKHSRDGSDDINGVLIPKTLRIDDPNEAAKSSIWATLGISKKEKENSGGRMFEGFQLAYDERNTGAGKSLSLLETNPAAMSRSLTFQETAK